MRARPWIHNRVVTAILPLILSCLPAFGQTAKLDDLFQRLKSADESSAHRIVDEIWIEWSKSGSAAMDLLLQRGRTAMEAGQTDVAIEHFTALIDHAPDFAEGWHARATAWYNVGELGPAISDIAQVLERNPRHFGALTGLGLIFEELGRPEKALEVYHHVLEIDPYAEGIAEDAERLETVTQGQDL